MKAEKVLLTFENSHKEEVLKVLRSMRFILVEHKDDILDKFLRHAPQNVPLTDEDIIAEITAYRNSNENCY